MWKQMETFIELWCLKSLEKKKYYHKENHKKPQNIAVSLCKIDLHNYFFFNVEPIVTSDSVLETFGVLTGVSAGIPTGCLFRPVAKTLNLFQTNVTLRYPSESINKPEVFWCFQGVQKKKTDLKWDKTPIGNSLENTTC